MRITTNALIRNYKSGLNQALLNMRNSMEHVMTQRSFNSVAENPAAAARSSQLWHKYMRNNDHISLVGDVQDRQTSQEAALMQVNKIATQIGEDYSIQVLNGTNGKDSRDTFAAAIREYQQSMVLSMNTTYGDTFVFAGADGKNPPFELTSDGKVTFRGIDVSTTDPGELEDLKKMAGEALYVDLGFGLTIENGEVVSSSAFNISLPGINALGYGSTDGSSDNMIALAGQLADELEKDDFDADKYGKLLTKFQKQSSGLLNQVTELGVKSEFLESTKNRLKDNDINLQTQIHNVEGIDMAEAITSYSWAQYAYNAALKVGTNILSPSFIDFMS